MTKQSIMSLKNGLPRRLSSARNDGFTRLVNPSRSSSRSFVSATQSNFCSRSPELRPSGFTLAEVLITLVIIGVIAAITVPSLINKTNNQETVSRLKKAYSVLQNSIHKIALNNGYAQGDYSFFNNVNFIDEFEKVANVAKKCDTSAECFGATGLKNYLYLDGTSAALSSGKSVITSDGQMYTFAGIAEAPALSGISDEDKLNTIGRIIVDINGKKKPNKIGLDTFHFYIVQKKGVVPAGSYSTSDCNKSGRGNTCAAKVLREGAINY